MQLPSPRSHCVTRQVSYQSNLRAGSAAEGHLVGLQVLMMASKCNASMEFGVKGDVAGPERGIQLR